MKNKFMKKIGTVILSCVMAVSAMAVCACGGNGGGSSQDGTGFSQLTYVAFGDSITWGEIGKTQEQMEKPYPVLVKEALQLKQVRNYGERNATIKYIESKPNVVMHVKDAVAKADIVSVLVGINDFGAGCALGTIEDTSCTQSVYGGFNDMATRLQEKYPNAFIFFMTPLTPFDWAETNKAGYTLLDLCNAIKEVAASKNIAVLDLNATSGFSAETDKYCPDGLHPSQYFFETYMAPQIAQFIKDNYAK